MSHPLHYTEPPHEQPDAWHRHIPEDEGLPQEEHGSHTRSVALALAFLLCFGFVAGTILASYLYFNVHLTALRRERIESTVFAQEFFKKELDYKPAGLVGLNDYRFPTEDQARKGIAALPIDEAKKRVIARYAGGAGQK